MHNLLNHTGQSWFPNSALQYRQSLGRHMATALLSRFFPIPTPTPPPPLGIQTPHQHLVLPPPPAPGTHAPLSTLSDRTVSKPSSSTLGHSAVNSCRLPWKPSSSHTTTCTQRRQRPKSEFRGGFRVGVLVWRVADKAGMPTQAPSITRWIREMKLS